MRAEIQGGRSVHRVHALHPLGRNLHLKQAPFIPGPTTPLLRAHLLSLLSLFIITHVSVISDLLLYLFVDVYFLTYFCLSPHIYPRLTGLRKKSGLNTFIFSLGIFIHPLNLKWKIHLFMYSFKNL